MSTYMESEIVLAILVSATLITRDIVCLSQLCLLTHMSATIMPVAILKVCQHLVAIALARVSHIYAELTYQVCQGVSDIAVCRVS